MFSPGTLAESAEGRSETSPARDGDDNEVRPVFHGAGRAGDAHTYVHVCIFCVGCFLLTVCTLVSIAPLPCLPWKSPLRGEKGMSSFRVLERLPKHQQQRHQPTPTTAAAILTRVRNKAAGCLITEQQFSPVVLDGQLSHSVALRFMLGEK